MKSIVNDMYVVVPYNPNIPGCCVYLVDTKSDDGLVLIDVGFSIEPIQKIKNDGFDPKNIKHCLITHGHIDHYGACHELKNLNENIRFYAHVLDADRIEQKLPENSQYFPNYEYETIKITNKIKDDNEILEFGKLQFKCIHIPGHTEGSVAYLLETENKRILFGGDVPGVVLNTQGGNLEAYLRSMKKLLSFNIDIMCEGHEDIIEPAQKVSKFLKGYIQLNEQLNEIVENPQNPQILLELTLLTYELQFYENALDFCNYLLEIDPDNTDALKLLPKIKKHNPIEINYLKGLLARRSNREE